MTSLITQIALFTRIADWRLQWNCNFRHLRERILAISFSLIKIKSKLAIDRKTVEIAKRKKMIERAWKKKKQFDLRRIEKKLFFIRRRSEKLFSFIKKKFESLDASWVSGARNYRAVSSTSNKILKSRLRKISRIIEQKFWTVLKVIKDKKTEKYWNRSPWQMLNTSCLPSDLLW